MIEVSYSSEMIIKNHEDCFTQLQNTVVSWAPLPPICRTCDPLGLFCTATNSGEFSRKIRLNSMTCILIHYIQSNSTRFLRWIRLNSPEFTWNRQIWARIEWPLTGILRTCSFSPAFFVGVPSHTWFLPWFRSRLFRDGAGAESSELELSLTYSHTLIDSSPHPEQAQ